MNHPESLNALLQRHAGILGDDPLYTFLDVAGEPVDHLSFAGLERRARAIGGRLSELGATGERVVLLFSPGLDFVAAFFGCLYAGAVPVPAYPPRRNRNFERLRVILADATPRLALTEASLCDSIRARFAELPSLRRLPVHSVDELEVDPRPDWTPPAVDRNTLAFLQYTSGSTSAPRGVMVTHGNLLANERVLQAGFQDEGTVVSWLPLFHDMGLIGMVIRALYVGVHCVLMAPTTFLRQPVVWLRAISRWRAGLTGAPDFAYNLCARKVTAEEREGLDLSCLNVAFNGAEPVRAGTLDRFSEVFAPCGFRREAFYPAYGLAEATLMAAGGNPAAEPVVWEVDAAALEGHRAAAARAGSASRRLVASGRQPAGHRLVVADPETGVEIGDGGVGEIWYSGPSVARGYWGRPELSETTFRAHLAGDPETAFLRTGDLGFFRRGELFVTGREKDLVIVRGRNHYPQDLELTAERSHREIRSGCSAAFTVEEDGEERLVLVSELRRNYRSTPAAIGEAIRRALAEVHEIAARDVVLIRIGTLPKTSSGKIQRAACRALYLAGELREEGRSRLDGEPAAGDRDPEAAAESDPAIDPVAAQVEAFLIAAFAELTRRHAGGIDPTTPMTAQGLDSLSAVELLARSEESLGVSPELDELLNGATPRGLARQLAGRLADAGDAPRLVPALRSGGDEPLSDGQRALWFLHRLEPSDTAYHLVLAGRLQGGRLDARLLARCIEDLARRHPVLRTTYHEVGGEPRGRTGEAPAVEVTCEEVAQEGRSRRMAELALRPFDLESGPVMRLGIFETHGEQRLVVSLHHLVADLWSFAAMLREVQVLYAARAAGRQGPAGLPAGLAAAPRSTLGDFARWQETMLAGSRGDRLRSYWQHRLAGAPTRVRLPVDIESAGLEPAPDAAVGAARGGRGGRCPLRLAPALEDGLERLARRLATTPFTVVLGVLQILLHRYSGDDDLLVGTPVTLRRHAELAQVAGYLVNTIVLRSELAGNPAVAAHLGRQQRSVAAALAHGDYPHSRLVEHLRPGSGPGRSPLFQVMLAWQQERPGDASGLAGLAAGATSVAVDLGCLRLDPFPLPAADPQCDLVFSLATGDAGLSGELHYDRTRFDAATVERMADHFANLLVAVVTDADRRVFDLPFLSAAERHQLVAGWNPPIAAGGMAEDLQAGFEAQVRRRPAATALVADRVLTFEELEREANRLAHRLVGHGIGGGSVVALALPPSADLVIALLAVLKAGAAFLVADPELPGDRVAFMLEDSGATSLVQRAAAGAVEIPAGVQAIHLDADRERTAGLGAAPPPGDRPPALGLPPSRAAYVVYTSGSTGRPKGVVVSHAAAARHMAEAGEHHRVGDADRMLLTASFSFDVALEDLLATLGRGGSVALAGSDLVEPAALLERSRRLDISLMDLSPGYLAELVRVAEPDASGGRLRRVIVGGDSLPPETVRRWLGSPLASVPLVNAYGPTEAVVTASCCEVTAMRSAMGTVPIGRPFGSRQLHVVDRGGHAAPVGAVGELVIGGPLLARGYVGRPGLTADRFVPDPFGGVAGGRLYRTGDRARRLPDGRLEHLGRLDRQVQVRGFRVEPGEVEAVLRELPQVADAAVVARSADPPGDEVSLVAYVVLQDVERGLADVERHLARRLPRYMLPNAVVPLASLPRDASGKVDRQALPAPAVDRDGGDGGRELTPAEERLAALWRDVLGATGPAPRRIAPQDDFFALGGHSLSALRLLSRIRDAFGVELDLAGLLAAPRLAALAARIGAAEAPGATALPIDRVARDAPLPLSHAQERLWFLDRMLAGSPRYHLAGSIRLEGPLEVPALAAAVASIVRRHEVLRGRVVSVDDEPRVRFAAGDPGLPRIDLAALPAARRAAAASELVRRQGTRPFDLEGEGPLRVRLLRLGEAEHLLAVTFHHIACDGWSVQIFQHELEEGYAAYAEGRRPRLPALPVQYADYASWQRRLTAHGGYARQLEVWRHRLAGAPVLELPVDRPRPSRPSARGGEVPFRLAADRARAVEALARRHDATPFMVLLAAFQALLARYSGQRDVVVGTVVANRGHRELEPLLGFFVNTVVLRGRVTPGLGFDGLLAEARERTLEAHAHQDLPFDLLVEALGVSREAGGSPLVQVMLAFEQAAVGPTPASRLWQLEPVSTGTAKFDLTFEVVATDGSYAGRWELSKDLFDRTTVLRMEAHFQRLLAAVLADPGEDPWRLALLDEAERQAVLREWNRDGEGPADGAPVGVRFARQAQRRPAALAVTLGERSLTYGELDERARHLAARLRDLGVAPESRVGLCMERSLELVVGILGIVLAGGAYVPLDPALPEDRRRFILDELGASVVVTGPGSPLVPSAAGPDLVPAIDPGAAKPAVSSAALPVVPDPDHPAYVIYTSGSTGRPKGVVVTHRNLSRLFSATQPWFGFGEDDVWTLFHSYAFDFSVWEMWGALVYGGRLVVVPYWTSRSPEVFLDLLRDEGVTVLNQTPSAFAPLVAEEERRSRASDLALRWVIFGGEALDPAILLPWFERHGDERPRAVNMYGITETTVHVTFRPLTRADAVAAASSAIGEAIPDLRAHVVDRGGRLVPVGVHGELWVAGEGLARGYLRRSALTAERFVPDPFSPLPGARLYRSGDLARRRADGDLEYLGRIDQQVKIRGHRVELGEVEAALRRLPEVREAVVVDDPNPAGGRRLVAYVVAAAAGSVLESLSERLGRWLPVHMIPTAWVSLDEIPLTANGKVNRKALPRPAVRQGAAAKRSLAPVEELLAGIWEEVLAVPRVAPDDNFFWLGGHSLLATRVASRIRRIFGVELPLPEIFEAPTLTAQASRITRRLGEVPAAGPALGAEPAVAPGEGAALSFAQQRLWFLQRLDPAGAAYNMPGTVDLVGPLEPARLHAALQRVVDRQGSLRTAIEMRDGEPVQVVNAAVEVGLPRVDLSALGAETRHREAARLARCQARRPFDPAVAPLLRATLLVLGAGSGAEAGRAGAAQHAAVVVLHHLVADGWSVDVLVHELASWYQALGESPTDPDPELPELPVQYVDYAAWQRRWLEHGALERQLAYWRHRLAGAPQRLALPTDRPRPAEQSLRGSDLGVRLDGDLHGRLSQCGRRHGASLFMTLLAGFQVLLARYSGQSDVLVGTPVANRDRFETEPLIGLFVNTLVMRGELAGSRSFSEVLSRVRHSALGAYVNQDVPFELVVDDLATDRSVSHTPLFQVALVLQNQPPPRPRAGGVDMAIRSLDNGTAKFDLTLELTETGDGLAGRLEYAAALFDVTSVERMSRHLAVVLAAMAADPERSPWLVPLLGAEERRQVLVEWGGAEEAGAEEDGTDEGGADRGGAAADSFEPVLGRVLRAAAAAPATPAVVAADEVLTYGELDRRSAALARRLAARGVGAEGVVGVCLAPSPELVVAILAIHRAGAAYLPLDPSHPEDRRRYSLEDSGARLVLAREEPAGIDVETWTVDAWGEVGSAVAIDAPSATPEQLAYVIYTSGTTGRPKGTGLTHRGLACLVAWHCNAYGLTAADRASLVASPAFDASVWEMWPYLAVGAAIHVPPAGVRIDPPALYRWLAERQVTLAFLPTPLAEAMLAAPPPADIGLRALLVGGDYLHAPPRRDLPFSLVNHYGLTEDGVVTTSGEVRVNGEDGAGTGAVPTIGGPISGHQALLLDAAFEPVPAGVEGELWVAGEGLARGYLGRPGLTADRFRPHPHATSPGARAYRSGDLARWRAGGRLDYRGRIDHQVKIRGYRIELDEVEASLRRQPGVEQAVAVVDRDELGSGRIVAFVTGTAAGGPIAAAELRALLEADLPAYMVPALIHRLDRLPLTANGKADRAELVRRSRDLAVPVREDGQWVAPREGTESLLAGIWEEVLGVERVGAGDNFFALGGDSILSIKIVARARDAGLALTPQHLFQHQTVARLAAAADRTGGGAEAARDEGDDPAATGFPRARISRGQLERLLEARAGRAAIEDLLPLSPLQQGMLFHVLDAPESGVYVHQQSYLLEGDLDVDAFEEAFRRAVDRHQVLRAAVVTDAGAEPLLLVARHARLPWSVHDWRRIPVAEQRGRTETLFRADLELGFELAREPLMRCTMVRLSDDLFHFAWTFHLMLLDGWSTPLVLDDVLTFYEALRQGREVELPPPVPYHRYVDWLVRQDRGAAESYWRRLLDGFTRPTPLGGDNTRSAATSQRDYGERTLLLGAEASGGLRAFAARHRLTLNTVFQGVWALYLSQRSATDDVVFGTVVAGRPAELPGVESIVGLFLNTLPVRASVAGDVSMVEWLANLQQQQAEARRYAYASQADVRRWSGVPAGTPLYESILIFQNVPAGPSFDPGERWPVRVVDVSSVEKNNFPLTVAVEPGERLLLRFVYDAQRFAAPTVARMLDGVRRLLVETVEDPRRVLAGFSRSSEVERSHLIQGFNQDLEVR